MTEINLQDWVGRSSTEEDTASSVSAARLATLLEQDVSSSTEPAKLFPVGHWLHFAEDDVPMSELGTDGHVKLGGFMPPVGLPRRMWAGSNLQFHSPILAGQKLSRTTTIESITEKTGGSGRLCFRHPPPRSLRRWKPRDNGSTHDRLPGSHLGAGGSTAAPAQADSPAPEGWGWVRSVRPNEVTLFRYSALTFNSHRIHYDHPYVTGVEGYPGLVTHGPLTATLLLDAFMKNHPEATVATYDFRAKSPLFANEQIHLVGRSTGANSHELEAIAPDGKTAIAATVTTTES